MKKIFAICFLIALIFTACINVNVEQKLKRSGKYDLTFTISTSEEFSTILDGMEEAFVIPEEIKDKYEFERTETSISHKFKNLDPETDTKIFEDVESDDPNAPDTGLVDPKRFDFETETKFPYYIHTYTFSLSNEKDSNESTNFSETDEMLGALFQMEYTVEVFGSIVEADGEIEGNKVTYNLNDDNGEEHKIVFKDFFLMAWLGSKYGYLLVIGLIIFILALVLPYFLIKRKKVEINPKMTEYINLARSKGATDEKIKDVLLKGGWDTEQVNAAMKQK